jgi:hypothetical protein
MYGFVDALATVCKAPDVDLPTSLRLWRTLIRETLRMRRSVSQGSFTRTSEWTYLRSASPALSRDERPSNLDTVGRDILSNCSSTEYSLRFPT